MEQCLSELGLEQEALHTLSEVDKGRLVGKMEEKFVSIPIFMNFWDWILHIYTRV